MVDQEKYYSAYAQEVMSASYEREVRARAFKEGEKFGRFATLSNLICAFVAGVMAGYGWAYYHYIVL